MSRPTDWEEVFGFGDPTPGDPYSIRSVATSWSGLADDAEYAETKLNQLLGDEAISGWIGEAGSTFREKSYDLPGQLTKCKNSYRMASEAMSWWADKLDGHQYDADRALDDGRAAKHELDSANATLDDASGSGVLAYLKKYGDGDPPEGVDKPSDSAISSARNNLSSAQGAVHSAQSKLDAARKLAADAGDLREDDGKETADKIREASDAGIEERSWWEKAKDWVEEAWDILIEICKIVVLVLGIVALIIGGPLAWVVFAAAVLVLADTIMKYLNGECGLMDVLLAAVDCIPGTKGLTSLAKLGKLAKGAKGLMGAKGGLKALTVGLKDIKVAKAATKISGETEGVAKKVLTLKRKPTWTAAQNAEFDKKLAQLQNLAKQGKLQHVGATAMESRISGLRKIFLNSTGLTKAQAAGKDVDHIHDLQLGGKNFPGGLGDISNLQLLDLSVNRSVGAQIRNQLKNFNIGDIFDGIDVVP